MMTSSPASRNAVNTEYWPEISVRSAIHSRMNNEHRTLIGATCDQDLRLHVQIFPQLGTVEVFDRIAKADSAFGMGVVVSCDSVERFVGRGFNPLRRREIHVALPQVEAVRWQVGNAVGR